MKTFHTSATVLLVSDLLQSVDYYCDVLGFERPYLWGDPPGFAMPKREHVIVMLSLEPDATKIIPQQKIWDIYFWVVDADRLHQEFKKNGAHITQQPTVTDYNNLEFVVQDPDGYRLAFGEGLDEQSFFTRRTELQFEYMNPVLASADVASDIKWYQEMLGFKNVFDSSNYQGGPIDYAVLNRQDLYLHLQFQFPKDMTSTDLRIQVKNLELLFEEYLKTGVISEDAWREKTPWGTNEFGLFDPNRNRIHFYEDI